MKELFKIETYIPLESLEQIKNALYEHGFGKIGNYENCLNWYKVNSSWKPVGEANPYQGEVGKTEFANEYKVEFRCSKEELELAAKVIRENHPYEEVCINAVPIIEI